MFRQVTASQLARSSGTIAPVSGPRCCTCGADAARRAPTDPEPKWSIVHGAAYCPDCKDKAAAAADQPVKTVPSQEASEQYVRQRGVNCPHCGSNQLEGGPVEIDAGVATQNIGCLACQQEWTDQYKLVGILYR